MYHHIYSGVPSPPRKAEYTEEEDGVMMVWKEGSSGDADVIGFVIEGFHDSKYITNTHHCDNPIDYVLVRKQSFEGGCILTYLIETGLSPILTFL